MSDQKVICITAAQRAGTTALQHALAASGTAKNYGEIFHTKGSPSGRSENLSFAEFARENDIRLADAMQLEGASDIARRYLDRLKKDAYPRHVLIDVKLNSWFALSPAWNYPHEPPFFLRLLKREAAIFIFIWRESLADQVLSTFISRELGIWHNLDRQKVAGRQISAPVKALSRLAVQICRSEEDIREHLRDYPRKIQISYEDLFRNGRLSAEFQKQLSSLLGSDLNLPGTNAIRKNDAKKSEVVRNFEKAVAVIDRVSLRYRGAMAAFDEV